MAFYLILVILMYLLYLMETVTQKYKFRRIKLRYKELQLTGRHGKSYYSISFKLGLLILFCVSAFRFNIGWDYKAYYDTIVFNRVTNIVENNELFTIFLINISKKYQLTNLFFFINSLVTVGLLSRYINKYSKDKFLSLLIFMLFPLFYLNSFSVIRIFTSISISLIAYDFLSSRKLFKYILTIFIASQFHKSALIALLFYPIAHLNLKSKSKLPLLLILPILVNFFIQMINSYFPRYSVYFTGATVQAGTKSIYLIVAVAILLLLFYYKSGKPEQRTRFNLFLLGSAIYLIFQNYSTIGHRLSLFGTIHIITIIPDMISMTNRKYKLVLITAIHIVLIASFIYTLIVSRETYIPYRTIWS